MYGLHKTYEDFFVIFLMGSVVPVVGQKSKLLGIQRTRQIFLILGILQTQKNINSSLRVAIEIRDER